MITFLVPRWPRLTLAIMCGGFMAAIGILVAIAPLGRVQDVDWLFAIHSSSSYLFISKWALFDWTRAAIYLALLAIGWRVGATPGLRQVCVGLLATVACGALISLVFCDLLHVSLFINAQAWRWFWLADVVAITLAPAILRSCWQRGYAGRAAGRDPRRRVGIPRSSARSAADCRSRRLRPATHKAGPASLLETGAHGSVRPVWCGDLPEYQQRVRLRTGDHFEHLRVGTKGSRCLCQRRHPRSAAHRNLAGSCGTRSPRQPHRKLPQPRYSLQHLLPCSSAAGCYRSPG